MQYPLSKSTPQYMCYCFLHFSSLPWRDINSDYTWETYATSACVLGTSSISLTRPVQWGCWEKFTVTSLPLALNPVEEINNNWLLRGNACLCTLWGWEQETGVEVFGQVYFRSHSFINSKINIKNQKLFQNTKTITE